MELGPQALLPMRNNRRFGAEHIEGGLKPTKIYPGLATVLVALSCVWVAPRSASGQQPATEAREVTWLGPDGAPLPFQSPDDLKMFLETADVVNSEAIGVGINSFRKVLLRQDGVRAHAIFRDVDVQKRTARVGDRNFLFFSDSYRHECAAYELALLLGFDNLPPAVLRRIRGDPGSLQLWLEWI